jgi:hypothetical protein
MPGSSSPELIQDPDAGTQRYSPPAAFWVVTHVSQLTQQMDRVCVWKMAGWWLLIFRPLKSILSAPRYTAQNIRSRFRLRLFMGWPASRLGAQRADGVELLSVWWFPAIARFYFSTLPLRRGHS